MNRKLCIITSCNLKYAPYVKLYTDILDLKGCAYDLVTWDKCNLDEKVTFAYHGKKDDGHMIKTFFQYIGFGRFLNRILKENDYDKLIVCNPAPLIFVHDKVMQKYNQRFIWDIRDDTPIRKFFKRRFASICKMASVIVTSSKRYESWIGRETVLSHNANREMLFSYYDYTPSQKDTSVIRLINAGKMIEQDENIEVLKQLGNNKKYLFIYYGTDVPGKLTLMDFCKKNQLNNVEFFGTYSKDEIIDLYRANGDLINILRAETVVNRDALPNKFYEAAIAGVPIVVYEHNTAISEYVHRYHLGIVLKDRSDVGQIAELLNEFNYEKYIQGRKDFLNLVLKEIDLFENTVISFLELEV